MPWKERSVMEERLGFVAQLLEGQQTIDAAEREKPNWGARKIREPLIRRLAVEIRSPPPARCTRCWTGTAWSSGAASDAATRPRARRPPPAAPPTISGAPTSRASSSSATAATVTPGRTTWVASICSYRTLQTIDNPFGARLSPMS